jgi:hypothetical protein
MYICDSYEYMQGNTFLTMHVSICIFEYACTGVWISYLCVGVRMCAYVSVSEWVWVCVCEYA